MINLRTLLIVFLTTVCITACTQERNPCLQPKTVVLQFGCYRKADTGTAFIDTLLPNANLGVPDSSKFLYYGADKTAKFALLFSPVSDSCRWMLCADSASNLYDTLSFYYERKLHFLSNACGYTYFYSLKNITTTHHAIDSIKITDFDITTNVNTEHVKVFF